MSLKQVLLFGLGACSIMVAVSAPPQSTNSARTKVQTCTDVDIKKVNLKPTLISVEDLIALRDKSCSSMDFEKFHVRRFAPFETTVYRIIGRLKSIRLDKEGDISFVVAGNTGAKAVIEIPESDECKGSPLLKKMQEVRSELELRYHPKTEASEQDDPVTVDGIGFLGSRRKPGEKQFGETVRLMPCLKIAFGKA